MLFQFLYMQKGNAIKNVHKEYSQQLRIVAIFNICVFVFYEDIVDLLIAEIDNIHNICV